MNERSQNSAKFKKAPKGDPVLTDPKFLLEFSYCTSVLPKFCIQVVDVRTSDFQKKKKNAEKLEKV